MAGSLADKVLRSARMLSHGGIEVGVLRRRIDTAFLREAGKLLADRFRADSPTLVLAPVISGLTVATTTAMDLEVPLLLARKESSDVRGFVIHRSAYSSSEGMVFDLHVAREDLLPSDRVLIVDDMIQHGQTTAALVEMVREAKAQVVGVAVVVEATAMGRHKLASLGLPDAKIVSLVKVDIQGNTLVLSAS